MNLSLSAREVYLGMYQSVRLLGEGGMGQAFLGKHILSGREVVIKVMHDHLARDQRLRGAFQRELQVMKRFRHQYAVALLDGAFEGVPKPCLILEYIRGESLEELLRRAGRLSVERVGRLLGQLCQVLHVAHGMSLLHRDISPGNIMVVGAGTPDESIKVMDFGLAQLGSGFFVPLEKLTGDPDSIGGGTPDYMSPEQVRGETVDHRADLYSVGIVLYQLLTGRLPFFDDVSVTHTHVVSDLLLAHVNDKPPKFRSRGVYDVPPMIEAVVQALLALRPRARPIHRQ
jgi:eukaryotic-like serine/threonine-protein kinase